MTMGIVAECGEEKKINRSENVKELVDQEDGWIICVDFENTNNDGRTSDGKKVTKSGSLIFSEWV